MINKKGQFYLIAALIIIAIIASLILKLNFARISPEPVDFNALSNNFEKEAIKIIDQGIASETKSFDDIQDDLNTFASEYADYANQKAPNSGFLYVFAKEGEITVVNYLVDTGEGGTNIQLGNSARTGLPSGKSLTLHRLTLAVGKEEFTRDLKIRASQFEGINLVRGMGDYAKINIGGIPYHIAITRDVQLSAITIDCSEMEGNKCNIRFVKQSQPE